jgi:hypothetical protein
VRRTWASLLRAYAEVVTLALVAQVGLAAELIGVIALGLYLLIFRRVNSVSVFSTRWVPVAASLICPRSWRGVEWSLPVLWFRGSNTTRDSA